jgi:quaternary ammonium compound-resistance protein SugE
MPNPVLQCGNFDKVNSLIDSRLNMYWLSLLMAGVFEMGWPLGLKLSNNPSMKIWGIALAGTSMALSGFLLWYSLKGIPIGTAYAVWTSIGAVGTFAIGVLVFGDPNIPIRWIGAALILLGVILLKMG